MTSLWFVVPAHGRFDLARVCLRQLARTCDTLTDLGVRATAVVVADDGNLETSYECGFATVQRDNAPLGRKWNDGYELACRAGADYVIPLGSDDWIDAAFVAAPLPRDGEVRCSRLSAIVREDGQRLQTLRIAYDGGDGVRVFPTSLLEPVGFRPAEDDRSRAIDTSVFRRLSTAHGGRPRLVYHDLHPLQIVDFKSPNGQLNEYADSRVHADGPEDSDPWATLAEHYPLESVQEMMALHERRLVAA